MIEPLSTLQISALPPLHGALVMLLGAYVALELGQRVRAVRSAERTPWCSTTRRSFSPFARAVRM